MHDVIIGIPTYFAGQMLTNCVNAILENVPDAKLFIYKNEIGWLQACNYIMRETQSDVILLNDDTIPLGNFVKEMEKVAYSDPLIGIVGAKMLAPNQETVINYGIYIGPTGDTAHLNYGVSKDKITKVKKQRAVEGSAMYIKRDLINEIGFFDERYTMGYRAEVSYCFLAREAGRTVVSSPKSEIVHLVSQTSARLNIQNDTHSIFMDQWGTKLKLGLI